jgi:putative transposase
MTHHTHLSAAPGTHDGRGKMMQSLGRRHFHSINSEYRRTGMLWEGRYRSALIDSETYLLLFYRYVERNPVRAGMSDSRLRC